ncbi:MAG TPA: ABC transporter permease subunit [Marmoricola sp.]|nr:ABC transporter permease subunit [Marmoricola sp.]
MTWLTWRQLRVQAAVVYAAVLALALALLATRSGVLSLSHANVDAFLANLEASRRDATLYEIGTLVVWAVPAVIGAFWGAPVVARELEAGTHRLVWTQSVTRSRWLAIRLGVGVVAAMAATALVSLTFSWWCSPIDKAVNGGQSSDMFGVPRIVPEIFGARGIAPIGYAAFAFMLGVAAGALIRRTVPAMAVMLVIYIVVQVAMPSLVRPHLAADAVKTITITRDNLHGLMGRGPDQIDELDVGADLPGAWVRGNRTIGSNGAPLVEIPSWVVDCLAPPPAPGQRPAPGDGNDAATAACFDRLASEGIRQRIHYQPASHYWTLQWRETGLMLLAAGGLAGLCFWRVRRLS